MATAAEFTLFPQLPLEIRLQIWKFALPGSRIISFKPNPDYQDYDTVFVFRKNEAAHPNIGLLSVCNEARSETLRHYYPLFCQGSRPPQLYLGYKDFLCINPRDFPYFDCLIEGLPAKAFILETNVWSMLSHRWADWGLTRFFPSLEYLMVANGLFNDAEWRYMGNVELSEGIKLIPSSEDYFKLSVVRTYLRGLEENYPGWVTPDISLVHLRERDVSVVPFRQQESVTIIAEITA